MRKSYNPLENLTKYQKQENHENKEPKIEFTSQLPANILGLYNLLTHSIKISSQLSNDESTFVYHHELYHATAHSHLLDTPTEQAERNAEAYASAKSGKALRLIPQRDYRKAA